MWALKNAIYPQYHSSLLAGTDFNSTGVDIVFESNNSPGKECTTVTVFDDTILENVEEFLVVLASPDPDVTVLDPSIINVSILDNDGMNSLSHNGIAEFT